MDGIIEIRSYRLKPGTAEHFGRIMLELSLPLLEAAGTTVILACASLHAPDCYVLMRAYRDLAHRDQSQDEFYGSKAWIQGPREAVLACIDNYTTVVIDADSCFVDRLHRKEA